MCIEVFTMSKTYWRFTMKFLRETLQTMQKGLAHQHSGEYMRYSEKVKAVADVDARAQALQIQSSDQKVSEKKEKLQRKKVAMYLGGDLPASLINYVIDTCESLKHDLVVLTFEPVAAAEAQLKQYEDKITSCNITVAKQKLKGSSLKELESYLRKHPEIAFLACKDTGFLGRNYLSGSQVKISLPTPVVVIAEGNSASTSSDEKIVQLKTA